MPSGFKRLTQQGIIEAAVKDDTELLPPLDIGNWDDDTPDGETPERRAFKQHRIGQYLNLLRTLPERTALLCPQSDLAESVVGLVHECGLDRTHRLGELALDNNSPDDRPVSGVRFDIEAQV